MKKLFTTLLMLGAFGLAQAAQPVPAEKLSVTSFSNGVLTVNYDKHGGGPADAAKVKDILNKWIEDLNPELRGPENEAARLETIKNTVTTLKLTGDWENAQMVVGEPIPTLVNMCATEAGVGLDLSECTGLECVFDSVTETYDQVADDGEVTFTYHPVTVNSTERNEVQIIPMTVVAEERPLYHEATYIKHEVTPNIVGNEITVVKDHLTSHETYWVWGGYTQIEGLQDLVPVPGQVIENVQFNGASCTVEYDYDAKCWILHMPDHDEIITAKRTFTNDRTGETVDANSQYVQQIGDDYYYIDYIYALNQGEAPSSHTNPPSNAMQFGDKWFIPEQNSSTFTFKDEKDETVTKSWAQVFSLLTQDEDGNWWYEGYKYNDANNDVKFSKTTDGFVLDENGKYQFRVGSYYVYEDEDGIEHQVYDTTGLTQNSEGQWIYSYTAYKYQDKFGNWVVTPNKHDPYNLTEDENKNLWYVYQKTEGNFSFEGYEDKISSIIFPDHENFTFIPDRLFQGKPTLQSAVLSDKIVAIGNHAFASATGFSQINFPSSIEEIGGGAFENTRLTEVNLTNTKIKRIRWCTFMKNPALTTCTYPTTLEMIEYNAFLEDRNLQAVDLSECHKLTLIGHKAYEENEALLSVKVCAHPKVIQGGHGSGAFYNCKDIKTVEIVMNDGCSDVTDITQCYCEIGGFDADVTYDQTVADLEQIDKTTARLIFPENAPVGNSTYNSSWDFFVGDYKAGKAIKQESLENYYKDVPWSDTGLATDAKTQETIGAERYSHNGWLEFINTGHGVVITPEPDPSTEDKYTFLRTYSRSKGDGPVLLPREVIAYRAIDYGSTKWEMVENPEGTYYKPDENVDEYELIPQGEEPEVRYSKGLTIGGQILLRPLKAKVAEEGKNPNVYADYITLQDKTETYTTDEGVYGYWLSYVPENTGVVLYSTNISEKVFLVMKAYDKNDLVLKEYPNTEQCYLGDGTIQDQEDRINMLEGSYDEVTNVAPVFPWNWDKGTYYKDDRQYRNFGFNKSLKKWIRLKVGQLRLNRAFAQVPASRFDNFNESDQQQPDFTFEDEINDLENSQYQIALGLSFEDENTEIDGIKTVNTNSNVKVNDDAWYTLQGVKVNKPVRGVYIHNNQKVVIK